MEQRIMMADYSLSNVLIDDERIRLYDTYMRYLHEIYTNLVTILVHVKPGTLGSISIILVKLCLYVNVINSLTDPQCKQCRSDGE